MVDNFVVNILEHVKTTHNKTLQKSFRAHPICLIARFNPLNLQMKIT